MAIDFPNSPSNGDIYTVSGKQWQYVSTGTKWIAYGVTLAPDVLKVDSANNRVGINDTTPSYSLDVNGTARITGDLTVQGTTTTIESAAVNTSLGFEGATADAYETTLTLVDPTADRTITLPNNTGTVALTTDNVASATALANARTIGGVSFDGTANIAVTLAATATALATARTIGGTSFDGTANIAVGLAATATALATGRTINGVSFDGTANITVVDSAALPLAGGTLSGELVVADQLLTRPVIKDYGETKVAMAAHAVDLSLGNVQTYTLSGNQTLTFTNPPASGTAGSFTLIVTNGGSATLTWPTSVDWAAATAPTLTSSGVDVLTFLTVDGGTIWYGFAAGLAMA